MTVLVDTPVWSLALREGRAQIMGAIRQELLSGIREEEHFHKLRDYLRAFEEPGIEVLDYEEAAHMHNRCRSRGIAGSAIDFLICAVAKRRDWHIFTTDHDFERYGRVLGLDTNLRAARASSGFTSH
jgi:predicted nucleic acid-binding protein